MSSELPNGTQPPPVKIVLPVTPEGKPEPLKVDQVSKSPRAAAIQWLSKEGPITVLLFLIVGLLAFGVPWYVVPAINLGYQKNAEIQKATIEMILESSKRDREMYRETLREMNRHP